MGFFAEGIGIIAYKGASAYTEPGTIESIEKAIELGAHGVYLDVGVKDGKVVVEPEAGGLAIKDVAEIIKNKVKLVLGARQAKLSELLVIINELSRLGILRDTVLVMEELALISEVRDRIRCATRINNPFPNVASLKRSGVDFLIIPHSLVRARVVKEARARGVEVIAWLVNDPTIFLKMESLGVSAVITEKPDIEREARKIA